MATSRPRGAVGEVEGGVVGGRVGHDQQINHPPDSPDSLSPFDSGTGRVCFRIFLVSFDNKANHCYLLYRENRLLTGSFLQAWSVYLLYPV